MRINRILFSLLALLVLGLAGLATTLQAATYYVAKTGNNNNPGTQAAPWLTVQKAANTMIAGDTVNIAAGTYPEKVIENTSGTSGAHITYAGAGATSVTLGGFYLSGAYVDVTGVNLDGTNVTINDGCFQLLSGADHCSFSSSSITGAATYSAVRGAAGIHSGYPSANDCVFDNITITNPNNNAVVLLGTGHLVTNCHISGQKGWDCFIMIGDNITVRGNTVTDWSNPNANANHPDLFQTFGDDPAQTSRNVLIENNTVLHAGDDVQLGNLEDTQHNENISHWTFRNNLFCNIARTINVAAPYVSFTNNTFYRSGTASDWSILIFNNASGAANYIAISNNIFFDCVIPPRANAGWYTGDAVIGLVADYNLVIGSGPGTTKNGFSEAHGLNGVDPLFVNAAAGNFSLQAGSPALGRGMNSVAPVFTAQPANQALIPGTNVTFAVSATGIPTPAYQWKKNGVALIGATGTSYTIPSATPADSGSYTVTAANSTGSVTSNAAVLSAIIAPSNAFITIIVL